MRYHDAIHANIELADALAELARHGVEAFANDDLAIIEKETGDIIAEDDGFGCYNGGDIIGFLGY